MDITNIIKLLDAGFSKEDILKIAGENLLGGDPKPEPEPKQEPKQEPEPKQEQKPEPKPSTDIAEKLDKLIALTLANNFGAENPFNPNASEKAATDFFANIIAPDQGKEGAN